MNILLYQPEIPENTGNIIRLCANTGFQLHLIRPYGFIWDKKKLEKSGLDHVHTQKVQHYHDFNHFTQTHPEKRIFAFSSKASTSFWDISFMMGDILLFGNETGGLPQEIKESPKITQQLVIPFVASSRCLNLSNSVAIAAYEVLRKLSN